MTVDNVLVITGGAGGMGLACARALADRGRLLLVDVREDLLDQARKALSGHGADVETLRCNVTSPADVAAFADRVRELGRLRCLVHTAGVSPEMADAATVLDVDLAGSVRITDALFLESDAAAFISGCDIRVDGGLVGAGKHLMGVG